MNKLKLNEVVFGDRTKLVEANQQIKNTLTERAQALLAGYNKTIYSDGIGNVKK